MLYEVHSPGKEDKRCLLGEWGTGYHSPEKVNFSNCGRIIYAPKGERLPAQLLGTKPYSTLNPNHKPLNPKPLRLKATYSATKSNMHSPGA